MENLNYLMDPILFQKFKIILSTIALAQVKAVNTPEESLNEI